MPKRLLSPTADLAAEADTSIELAPGQALAARRYGRKRSGGGTPLVLHFHGGAFTSGDLDSGACLARLLASADAVVLSIAYPLAPAHPFPQAVEAGYGALQWLHKHRTRLAGAGARIFVAGEEAGGNLAAAVALVARDRAHPPLAGQILVAPMLDPCVGTMSLREAVGADLQCKWSHGWQAYLRSPMDAEHPYAVPGRIQRLAGLPPTLVLTGQDDPMRDEAQAYAKRLGEAGIVVRSHLMCAQTGWPDSLADSGPSPCVCADSVRAQLHEFFNATAPPS